MNDKKNTYLSYQPKKHVRAIVSNGTKTFTITGYLEDIQKDFPDWKIVYIEK
jgi:hypothetical protein